jgi:GR25 family glycosyltransferase involved in LPS biosynthesis
MQERFDKLGMDVTRFRASCPDDVKGNFAAHLNIGQKCCALSHYRLWEHIFMSGLDYALVIEDDARFDYNWREKLDQGFQQLDPDWDAIFLNCSEPMVPAGQWQKVNEQYLTGGYIISKKGVAKILGLFSQMLYASDWMTSRLQTMGQCYSYFPWLIVQDGSESTIGSDYNADHLKVLRCLGEINYDLEEHYC